MIVLPSGFGWMIGLLYAKGGCVSSIVERDFDHNLCTNTMMCNGLDTLAREGFWRCYHVLIIGQRWRMTFTFMPKHALSANKTRTSSVVK